MIVLGIIVGMIAVCMLIGAILHSTYFKEKLEQIKPYGQLVDVDHGQMHVYSIGNGEKTIGLLPGMGVSLPSVEFAPLMRKLSEKYTVVCVEYFGVGFSSETSKPRTCENYVEETRTTLHQAGFKAPYVLMPHSISSIYSEYYAAKYPDEVEAVISLEGTSSAYLGNEMPAFVKSLLQVAKFQQGIGFTSLLAPLTVNKAKLLSNGYTEKEISNMITFAGFSVNSNFLEQMGNTSEFIKQTMNLPFPESIPYFKVISKQTYETPNKQLKMTPQEYQQKHLERIGENAKYEILNGNHFIYLNNVERIAEITDDLLLNDKE
jgi:pimeloyl-ACP methyl ester carboxylesterase